MDAFHATPSAAFRSPHSAYPLSYCQVLCDDPSRNPGTGTRNHSKFAEDMKYLSADEMWVSTRDLSGTRKEEAFSICYTTRIIL